MRCMQTTQKNQRICFAWHAHIMEEKDFSGCTYEEDNERNQFEKEARERVRLFRILKTSRSFDFLCQED